MKAMSIWCAMVTVIVLLAIYTSIDAQEQTARNDESGKRSTIVEVDGYAYLSEDKTIKEMREEALTNAKREALERAQTYIQSISKVENFQLSYDLVQSQAEGAIRILESRNHGITDDNRYHYWIKAEVEYSLKPPEGKADLSSDLVKNPDAPLTVYVWSEKSEYQAGEKIRVFLQGNKDFYARVVYRDAQGNLLQLLPNPHRQNNFFEGGKVITIPGEGDRFDLEVGPPFGIENIIVYASSAEMGDADVETVGDALYGVRGGLENYGMKTRGVKIVQKQEGEGTSGAEFYEAKCEVKTRM
jgi:hypothetical protein